MVERQIVALDAVGSNPTILPLFSRCQSLRLAFCITDGVSPSGKAQDFDSCITLVRIQPLQPCGVSLEDLSIL